MHTLSFDPRNRLTRISGVCAIAAVLMRRHRTTGERIMVFPLRRASVLGCVWYHYPDRGPTQIRSGTADLQSLLQQTISG